MPASCGKWRIFKETANFPKWLYHFMFPSTVCDGSSCSISLLTLVTFYLLNCNCSSGCVVVYCYGFSLLLGKDVLNANDVGHLFMSLFAVHLSPKVKYLFRLSPFGGGGLSSSYWILRVLYKFQIQAFGHVFQILSPSLWLAFSFLLQWFLKSISF